MNRKVSYLTGVAQKEKKGKRTLIMLLIIQNLYKL